MQQKGMLLLERFFCCCARLTACCSIAGPLRALLECYRLDGGGLCALLCHVPFQLEGGSPYTVSVNRIDNTKGIGYPLGNVEVKQGPIHSRPPPPPPLIPSQVTCRAANLLVGSLRRHRIENLFRFDFLFVRTLNLMTLRIMRARCLSQYIARGQLDPTRDDVLAQLKALPASQHPVPPLEFFKQRVAQAALRDTKKFGQQTTS